MKRTILAAIAVLFTGSLSQALPLLTDSPLENTGVIDKCTDFRGKYQGTCTAEGRSYGESFEITQQGCEVLNIGGRAVHVGSLLSLTTANPALGKNLANAKATAVSTLWSADRKILELHGGVLAQDLSPKLASVSPMVLRGEMKLDGSKLLFSMREVGHGAGVRSVATCTLERQ